MASFEVTNRIRQYLGELEKRKTTLKKEERAVLSPFFSSSVGDTIPFKPLMVLVDSVNRGTGRGNGEGGNRVWFHELVNETRVSAMPRPSRRTEKELVLIAERRRAAEIKSENRAYSKMVKNIVEPPDMVRIKASRELKTAKSQAGIGINVLVSGIALYVCGFALGKHAFDHPLARYIIGLIFGIGIVLVEVWLFIIRGHMAMTRLKADEKKTEEGPFYLKKQ